MTTDTIVTNMTAEYDSVTSGIVFLLCGRLPPHFMTADNRMQ